MQHLGNRPPLCSTYMWHLLKHEVLLLQLEHRWGSVLNLNHFTLNWRFWSSCALVTLGPAVPGFFWQCLDCETFIHSRTKNIELFCKICLGMHDFRSSMSNLHVEDSFETCLHSVQCSMVVHLLTNMLLSFFFYCCLIKHNSPSSFSDACIIFMFHSWNSHVVFSNSIVNKVCHRAVGWIIALDKTAVRKSLFVNNWATIWYIFSIHMNNITECLFKFWH